MNNEKIKVLQKQYRIKIRDLRKDMRYLFGDIQNWDQIDEKDFQQYKSELSIYRKFIKDLEELLK